jgi:hypothetical protein
MFVALGIQHAMCTLHNVVCDLSGSTIYFHIISPQRHEFLRETEREGEKEVTANKICVLIFFTISPETFLILRRTERDMIKTVHRSACTVPVILV